MPALKRTTSQTEALIQAQIVLLENEIISRSDNPDKFRLINNQYNRLQSWHDLHTGWRIYRTPASIRLIRTPVSFVPGYIFRNLRQPRDFACFVWTLWYAESRLNDTGGHANAQQFLMSQLAERLEEHSATGYLAPHAAPFDFRRQADRYSLFHALKALEELGGLHLQDGSSEEWVNQSGQENALYEFTEVVRSLILALDTEQIRAAGKILEDNPHSLAPVRLPGTERISPLQRAWRTLLLGPALLKYDDPAAFAAVRQHQATVQFEIGEAYGWQLDLRYEYAMIIRPSGTGLGPNGPLNLNGAVDQAALLCCQLIRQKVVGEWHYPLNDGCVIVPESEIAEIFRQVRERDGSRWGSTARKTSFQELLGDVYAKLRLAGLMRGPDRDRRVLILPTLARFSVNYPPDEEAIPVSNVQEQRQQLSFNETVENAGLSREKNITPPTVRPTAAPVPKPVQETLSLNEAAGYNTPQAARLLGISQQSVSRWLNTGFIKGERGEDGRGWLIPPSEIERIKQLRHSASTPATTPNVVTALPEGQVPLPGQGYNTYQAARLLGVTDSTILNWLKKGKISGEKTGLNWSIPNTEIDRIKRSGQDTSSSALIQTNPVSIPAKVRETSPVVSIDMYGSDPNHEQSYTPKQTGELLGVARQTVALWLTNGSIKGEQKGRNWLIPATEIERVKALRLNGATPAPNVTTMQGSARTPVSSYAREDPTISKAKAEQSTPKHTQGYNTIEAAQLLGVSDPTILNWLKKGKIRGEKIGLSWSIPATEIDRIKGLSQGTPSTVPIVTPKGAATRLNHLLPSTRSGPILVFGIASEPSVTPSATANTSGSKSPPAARVNTRGLGGNREQGFNTGEAAQLLGVSDQTILNWLKKGKISGEKTGLNWSIPAAEIERVEELRRNENVALTIATRPDPILNSGLAGKALSAYTTNRPVATERGSEGGYTAQEAGNLFGVSGQTILNWLKKGSIRGVKSGTSWSIPVTEIERIKMLRAEQGQG